MCKLPVAKHLSDGEYKLLLNVYASHNRSMGLEERNFIRHSESEKKCKRKMFGSVLQQW